MTSPITQINSSTEMKPASNSSAGRFSKGLSNSAKALLISGISLACLAGAAVAQEMCYNRIGDYESDRSIGANGDEACWTDYYDRHYCARYQQAAAIVAAGNDTTAQTIMNALTRAYCGPSHELAPAPENLAGIASPSGYLILLAASVAARFFA